MRDSDASARGQGSCLYSPEGWTCVVGSNQPKHVVSIDSHRRWRNIPEDDADRGPGGPTGPTTRPIGLGGPPLVPLRPGGLLILLDASFLGAKPR
jgi:hypothetical protein